MPEQNIVDIVFRATDKFTPRAKKIPKHLDSMGKSAKKAGASTKKFDKSAAAAAGTLSKKFGPAVSGLARVGLPALAGAAGLGLVVKGFKELINTAAAAQKEMTRVATLGEFTGRELGKMASGVQAISIETGKAGSKLREALFQTISAGIPAARAMDVLAVSARAAVGGFGDTLTAVDGITSALNAFGLGAEKAEHVADIFFETNKRGKTTVEELAASISIAAPLMASAGGSLEDLAGFVATLTQTGAKTNVVMTQLRSILAAVVKPSDEAREAARELGIDFSTAGIRAKGLAGWLIELIEKTGGSEEKLAKFIGRVEGLSAVISLAGPSQQKYIENSKAMRSAAGESAKAFKEVSDTYDKAFDRMTAAMGVWSERVGTKFIPASANFLKGVTKVVEAMTPAAEETEKSTKRMSSAWDKPLFKIAEMTPVIGGYVKVIRLAADLTEGVFSPNTVTFSGFEELEASIHAAAAALRKTNKSLKDHNRLARMAAFEEDMFARGVKKITEEVEEGTRKWKALQKLDRAREARAVALENEAVALSMAKIRGEVEKGTKNYKEGRVQMLRFGDDLAALFGKQRGFITGWRSASRDFVDQTFDMARAGERAFHSLSDSGVRHLGDGLFGVIKGDMDSLGDAWKSFTDSLLRMFVNMVAEMTVAWAAAKFLNLPVGGGGGGGGLSLSGVGQSVASSVIGKGVSAAVSAALSALGFGSGGAAGAGAAAGAGTAGAGTAAGAGTSGGAGLIAGVGGIGAAAAIAGVAALAIGLTLYKRWNTPKNTPEMSGAANIAYIKRLGKLAGLSATGNVQSSSDPNWRPSIEEVIRRTGGNRTAAWKILAPYLPTRLDDGDGAAHGAFALAPARLNVGERGRAEAIVPLEDERGLRMMTEVMVRAMRRPEAPRGRPSS